MVKQSDTSEFNIQTSCQNKKKIIIINNENTHLCSASDARHCSEVVLTPSILATILLGTNYYHPPLLTDKETDTYRPSACPSSLRSKCKTRTTLCVRLLPCYLWIRKKMVETIMYTKWEMLSYAFSSGHFPLFLALLCYLPFIHRNNNQRTTEEARQTACFSFYAYFTIEDKKSTLPIQSFPGN